MCAPPPQSNLLVLRGNEQQHDTHKQPTHSCPPPAPGPPPRHIHTYRASSILILFTAIFGLLFSFALIAV